LSPLIKHERLIRIELSLTPKQAALLMVRKMYRGKTSDELERWLIQHPVSEYPRPVLAHQMEDAVRSAMKGQEDNRVYRAVRQAQMHSDFLFLLVNQTNWTVLHDNRCCWLQILLLREELKSAELSDDQETTLGEWICSVRAFAIDLFSLHAASTLIQQKYFNGECILLKDVIEDLRQQTKLVKNMMAAYDGVVVGAGEPELATESNRLNKDVDERASARAGYIVAQAKSKMLDHFGQPDAANEAVKPYILIGQRR
jgi:hypothetical protein